VEKVEAQRRVKAASVHFIHLFDGTLPKYKHSSKELLTVG